MLKRLFQSIHITRFHQSMIFFSIFYITLMIFLQYKLTYLAEENYEVPPIENYTKRLASKVEVGIFINHFSEFSFSSNSFMMDALVWFSFPANTESIETIEQFSFKNGEILSKSTPNIQLVGNEVVVSYQVVVKFITMLNYKYFPASDHKLTVVLENKSVSPRELYFECAPNNLTWSENILVQDWSPSKKYVQTGYIQSPFSTSQKDLKNNYPCTVFTIDFKNANIRNFMILYLPLFLIFFLIFISLLTVVDDLETRFQVIAGVIPILALHSLVLEGMSPKTNTITKVDQIYLTLLALALIILLFQSYVGIVVKGYEEQSEKIKDQKKKRLKLINDTLAFVLLITLLASLTISTLT